MGAEKRFLGNSTFVLVILVILAVFAVALIVAPRDNRVDYREAECKQNLHNIQLAVERYGVDHDGFYPQYLIGGAARHSTGLAGLRPPQTGQISEVPFAGVSDPLVREGYLDAYTRNPFIHDKPAAQQLYDLQAALSSSITGDDPLRNGTGTAGALRGTRFGPDCSLMGQVLCDPRVEQFSYADPDSGETVTADSWAIVEYRAWDTWVDDRPDKAKHLLPGQFFYKAMGSGVPKMGGREVVAVPLMSAAGEGETPVANEHLSLEGDALTPPRFLDGADMYIMGGFGGERTKGKDILGKETEGIWTRSCYSAVRMEGSCFKAVDKEGSTEIQYGNPNGLRDGLILVLTAGEDYVSSR